MVQSRRPHLFALPEYPSHEKGSDVKEAEEARGMVVVVAATVAAWGCTRSVEGVVAAARVAVGVVVRGSRRCVVVVVLASSPGCLEDAIGRNFDLFKPLHYCHHFQRINNAIFSFSSIALAEVGYVSEGVVLWVASRPTHARTPCTCISSLGASSPECPLLLRPLAPTLLSLPCRYRDARWLINSAHFSPTMMIYIVGRLMSTHSLLLLVRTASSVK